MDRAPENCAPSGRLLQLDDDDSELCGSYVLERGRAQRCRPHGGVSGDGADCAAVEQDVAVLVAADEVAPTENV